jgi:hypothetical protein
LPCWRTSQILEWWVNDLFQVNTIDRFAVFFVVTGRCVDKCNPDRYM